ncbi:MAG: DUF2804 domain-containing protein [Candidatus Nanopelagicales bacterium]
MATEREITGPVDLCRADGRLNRAAVGWTRTPMHRANLRGRGRTKRWEYWAVMSPTEVFTLTVSDLDFGTLHAVWFLDADGTETGVERLTPLARADLPDAPGGGPVRARAKGLEIDLDPLPDGGTAIRAATDRITADLTVGRPAGHECLGVVVPWSDRRFQYTVKDNTLPATGTVTVDGVAHDFTAPDTWAVLDHGRGRWPHRITWNWGAGSGRTADGRTLGIQVGGRWTDGTGSTENSVTVDGRLSKVHDDLWWDYDTADWLRPWRIRDPRSGRLDLTLTPFHDRTARTELGLLGSQVHQCFGTWSGWVVTDDDERIEVDNVRGWAEEARQKW